MSTRGGRAFCALGTGLVAISLARADEGGAAAMARLREAYRGTAIHERVVIEVRGPGDRAEVSEGELRLDLASTAPVRLDLALGPMRIASDGRQVVVLHQADPDQFVGTSLESLTFAELERVLPSVPLPQLALAMTEADGDRFHIPSLLPLISLDEVARGSGSVTLTGQADGSTATLVMNAESGRLRRFQATIPAASGWYDLVVTLTPIEPGDDAEAPPTMPDTSGRLRVDRVAELRPRGLVLVAQADLGWLPIHTDEDGASPEPITLGSLSADRGPMLVGLVERGPDGQWLESARRAIELMEAARGGGWSLLLVFDPTGQRTEHWGAVRQALEGAGLHSTPAGWVDGRIVPLSRALPLLSPGVLAVDREGVILEAVELPGTAAGEVEAAELLRESLRSSP